MPAGWTGPFDQPALAGEVGLNLDRDPTLAASTGQSDGGLGLWRHGKRRVFCPRMCQPSRAGVSLHAHPACFDARVELTADVAIAFCSKKCRFATAANGTALVRQLLER